MELLLNLAWVLLALPAYWLWRRAGASRQRGVSSLQCVLALACVLVLLFPVISASDDVHAMRAEMEDSPISKRTVRVAAGERHSGWVNRLIGPAVAVANMALVAPRVERLQISVLPASPLESPVVLRAGRAPPCSFLG